MGRKSLILGILLGMMVGFTPTGAVRGESGGGKYTVAVYWWPNFHCDAFHQSKKGQGWNEWVIVKNGKPRFPGHDQPKVPLWGYRDESDPKEAARSIDALADAGVGAIIFDWYRYDDQINGGRMIERALSDGFLKAPNRERIKFALMWANHTYIDCHPFNPKTNFGHAPIWRNSEVSRAAFDRHTDDAIKSYFSQPNYWKIDGKPYFSFYELDRLIGGLGSLKETRAAIDGFRARTAAAGFPGLHLNFVDFSFEQSLNLVRGQPMPGDPSRKVTSVKDLMEALSADSSTWYTWVHHVLPATPKAAAGVATATEAAKPAVVAGPLAVDTLMSNAKAAGWATRDYEDWGREAMRIQSTRAATLGIPLFPHVARGWDGSPRNYRSGIVVGNTPERFKQFLIEAKNLADQHPEDKGIVTINSWNEWVEGSYLEPDTVNGMKYLDAIREVFGR